MLRDGGGATIEVVLASLVALLAPPRCLACAEPVAAGRPLCGGCRRDMPWLGSRDAPVYSPVAYAGPARDLVLALKFHGRVAAAKVMAAQIAANAPPGLLDGTLVPVPAHRARRRQRGFDPAALLARELARRTRLPVLAALVREDGPRDGQVGRTRDARLAGPDVRLRRRVDAPVLLVDDVVTTGATLRACAAALDTGAVAALTYARTIGKHPLRFP